MYCIIILYIHKNVVGTTANPATVGMQNNERLARPFSPWSGYAKLDGGLSVGLNINYRARDSGIL